MIRLRYELEPDWPPLAWLARCTRRSDEIAVHHGRSVETQEHWFGEAVWAGSYRAGDLDCTDIVFGSGARTRGDRVVFVSAASTVDRLQSFMDATGPWVSNSLPCLLATVNAHVSATYPHYARDFRTITRGLRHCRRVLETSEGPVQFTYFHNLVWTGTSLYEKPKPPIRRPLSSFAQYRAFIDGALGDLVANMEAPDRPRPYRLLGTMSSGYDSPTVAVLGKAHGLRQVLSFERYDLDPDSGAPLARRLGLEVLRVPRSAWQDRTYPEIPFLAADAKGEDVYFAGAQEHLEGRVLLTGFHGDKIWDRDTKALGPDIVRGDQSGLSLSEYRLRAGFIHCPVPFLGVRQIQEINAISRSAELEPWDVANFYSRPICRCIVEEAGIARSSFGTEKRVASVLFFNRESFLTSTSLADYRSWLSALEGMLPPSRFRQGEGDGALWHPVLRGAARLTHALADRCPTSGRRILRAVARRLAAQTRREPLFRHLFPWAIEHAKVAYHAEDGQAATQRRSPPHVQRGASRVG